VFESNNAILNIGGLPKSTIEAYFPSEIYYLIIIKDAACHGTWKNVCSKTFLFGNRPVNLSSYKFCLQVCLNTFFQVNWGDNLRICTSLGMHPINIDSTSDLTCFTNSISAFFMYLQNFLLEWNLI